MAGDRHPKVEPLQPSGIARLPAVCDRCPLPPGPPPAADQPWVGAAVRSYGCCGVRADLDGTTIGYILVSPPLHAPVRGPYASAGVSPDAAVVLQFYVHPDHRGQRLGRRLLEELAVVLVRRHVGGLEIRASRGDPTCLAPPEDWLLEQGFRVLRQEAAWSRLRMDLRSTRSWLPSFAPLARGVRQALGRPAAGPEAVGRHGGP